MNLEELIALEGRLETVKDWMNGLRMVAAHPIARQAAIHMTVIEAALTALQDREAVVREFKPEFALPILQATQPARRFFTRQGTLPLSDADREYASNVYAAILKLLEPK